jgi:hypothetical protein
MKLTKFTTLNIISWIQIIGGITGLGLIADLLLQTDSINGPILLIFLIGLGLFIFAIYTGVSLFFDKNKKKGVILTILNQFFQFFQWHILGYGMSYSSGAELLIGVKGGTLNFRIAAFISTFRMSIHSQDSWNFSINIASILIAILTVRYYLKVRKMEVGDPISPNVPSRT